MVVTIVSKADAANEGTLLSRACTVSLAMIMAEATLASPLGG